MDKLRKEKYAALAIQKAARKRLHRSRAQHAKDERAAAIVIQKISRGKAARAEGHQQMDAHEANKVVSATEVSEETEETSQCYPRDGDYRTRYIFVGLGLDRAYPLL